MNGNGATGVSVDSSLDLTLSENVQIGTGNIVIRRSSDDTIVDTSNACLAAGIVPLIERKAGAASDYHTEFVAQGFAPGQFRVISFDINFLDAPDVLNPDYRLGALGGGTITQAVIDNLKSKGVDFLD